MNSLLKADSERVLNLADKISKLGLFHVDHGSPNNAFRVYPAALLPPEKYGELWIDVYYYNKVDTDCLYHLFSR